MQTRLTARKFIFLLLCVLISNVSAQSPCTYTNTLGNVLDFSSLTNSAGWEADDLGLVYKINICGTVACTGAQKATTAGVCQMAPSSTNTNVNAGSVPGSFVANPASPWGAKYVYGPGDTGMFGARNSFIYFTCGSDAGPSYNEGQSSASLFVFNWATPLACPPSSGISGGWVFFILYVVGFFLYCVIGVIYKWRRLGASGKEMIPNVDFWTDLPNLVKDGFKFTFRKICGQTGGSYNSV